MRQRRKGKVRSCRPPRQMCVGGSRFWQRLCGRNLRFKTMNLQGRLTCGDLFLFQESGVAGSATGPPLGHCPRLCCCASARQWPPSMGTSFRPEATSLSSGRNPANLNGAITLQESQGQKSQPRNPACGGFVWASGRCFRFRV